MPAGYEQFAELRDVLARARELSVRTMIFDVEPLVAWWDTGREPLDRGLAAIVADLAGTPDVRVVMFATNSARRPSVIPTAAGEVVLAYARRILAMTSDLAAELAAVSTEINATLVVGAVESIPLAVALWWTWGDPVWSVAIVAVAALTDTADGRVARWALRRGARGPDRARCRGARPGRRPPG